MKNLSVDARSWRQGARELKCGMVKQLAPWIVNAIMRGIFLFFALAFNAVETVQAWSWQESYADVDPKGDLKWKPHPFVYEKGNAVRYIDFDAGNDGNSGETTAAAWKHHPWDPNATGKCAADATGDTYVFKRGVAYRGRLVVKKSGHEEEPIRLTSDPGWGTGEAILCGSEMVKNWT